jgi:hypothetical protein
MKKVVCAFVTTIGIFTHAVSWADPPFELPEDGSMPTDICERLTIDAAIVMAARQIGLPRSLVEGDVERHPMASAMIDRAYSLPIKSTEEESKQLVDDFSRIAYSVCNQARDKGLLE